jgi:predicted dehydrogenase
LKKPRPTAFAVIGIDHVHVFGMAHACVAAGAELRAWHQPGGGGLSEAFGRVHPSARAAGDEREILEDESIEIVLCAGVNAERAATATLAMRHGKDVLSDKPGMTSLEQLADVRRVQAETGRIYAVYFSERLENQASVRASELVAAGAIGRVVQTVGLGPHRLSASGRPDWFFQHARHGGILCDIGSHQIDQFLHYTGAESASIVAARIANHAHPEHPEFQDFGDVMIEAEGASGYARVDWFTPDGLPTWGDGRLTLLGTEGFIEIRKNVNLAESDGGSHLFLVDGESTQRIDCSDVELPFARQLLEDVAHRTETAISQAHCFRACELSLRAQLLAERVGGSREAPGSP